MTKTKKCENQGMRPEIKAPTQITQDGRVRVHMCTDNLELKCDRDVVSVAGRPVFGELS